MSDEPKPKRRTRPVTTGKAKARSIRVHDAEWAEWHRRAALAGKSLAEWLRSIIRSTPE